MAKIQVIPVLATPNTDGYTMYLLQTETNWEREAVTALEKRGHGVSISQPVFVNGDLRWCVCFRTVRSEIDTMYDLVVEEAERCQMAMSQPT